MSNKFNFGAELAIGRKRGVVSLLRNQTLKPQRIQLSRQRGFNLQDTSRALNGLPAVSVARPGRWGNPFCIGKTVDGTQIRNNNNAVAAFAAMLTISERSYPSNEDIIASLRGRNLACWCKPEALCHADVLLEVANG